MKPKRVQCSFVFFYKECKRTQRTPHSLIKNVKEPGLGIRSFQKNVPFFAFFSVLLKRTERSLRSFGFHKSPKTREKNGKERNVLFLEWKRTERSERKRTECPTRHTWPFVSWPVLTDQQIFHTPTYCTVFLKYVYKITRCYDWALPDSRFWPFFHFIYQEILKFGLLYTEFF